MDNGNYALYIFGAFIVLVLVLIIFYKIKSFFNAKKKNYNRREFLTKNEKDCFAYLKKIFPEYHICPQVSMGAVLEPAISTNNPNKKERSSYTVLRNQIQCKVIDFAMLNEKMNIEFIIELDDKSHDNKKDKDSLRDFNLLQAGIPTVRFRRVNGNFLSKADILKQLKNKTH